MSAPAGWQQDPGAPRGQLRWWDGEQWTEHVSAPPAELPSSASRPAPSSWPVGGGIAIAVVAACTVVILGSVLARASNTSDDEPSKPGSSHVVEVAPPE